MRSIMRWKREAHGWVTVQLAVVVDNATISWENRRFKDEKELVTKHSVTLLVKR